jgi:hypothetical protein
MKYVRARQTPGSVKQLPAHGALVRIDELGLGGPRKPPLHFLNHAQVVRVTFHASLEVEEQPLELHANDKTCHAQVEVTVDLDLFKKKMTGFFIISKLFGMIE